MKVTFQEKNSSFFTLRGWRSIQCHFKSGYLLLGILIMIGPYSGFGVKPEHESGEDKSPGRAVDPQSSTNSSENCKINAGDISKFANGEGYNFNSVVDLVAKPACAPFSNAIVAQEIAQGVNFNRTPFHLDGFSKGYSNLTIDGKRSVERGIQKNVAAALRSTPLSNRELLPVLGQLALLSPKSARSMLAYLITQELVSQELEGKKGLIEGKDLVPAIDIVRTLKKFGAEESLIVAELSNNVEEMAATSQADSLGQVLTGLALAARELDQFSLAFNSSAEAFKRGVKQSVEQYTDEERGNLLKAGFSAANASAGYSPSIEPGAQEINEVLGLLLRGQALDETTLKTVWRKVVEVAAASPGQTALAQALALSLTSEVIYLPKKDRDKVLECAKEHRSVAVAVQESFLEAWRDSRAQLRARKLKVVKFNERKEKFFEPWVSGTLELEVSSITPAWIKEVVNLGLVNDDNIQAKFPRFVLALMNENENASKKLVLEGGVEPMIETAMTSFNILWNLTDIYVPALNEWAKRHDEEN